MNTDRLLEFQILAQILHYGRASEKLFISQSVLSRHIQELESELNVQLFERSSHKVSLTQAGETLYKMSWGFMELNTNASEKLRSESLNISGSVRFGCLRPSMCDKLEDFIGRFTNTHSDISVMPYIMSSHMPEMLSMFHCLATPSRVLFLPESYKLRYVYNEKSWLVLPINSNILENTVSARILDGEAVFLPDFQGSSGSFALIAHEIERITSGRAKIVKVPTPETALMNVNLGRGFTILPRHRIDERRRNVSHVALKEDFRFETILYHNTDYDDPVTTLFEDELFKWMNTD